MYNHKSNNNFQQQNLNQVLWRLCMSSQSETYRKQSEETK